MMHVKIFALFVFIGVLGSFTEARSGIFGFPYGNGGLEDRSSPRFFLSSRLKRAVDSNGETTTKPTTSQATTTNPTTTDPTTSPSSTTPATSPTTTPSTEPTTPTTTPTTTTTTEATSPTTTPTTTSATTPTTTSATTPTTFETTPTTPSTTTPESTKPTPKPKKSTNDLESRSNFNDSEPEDSSKKPGSPSKGDKNPAPGPFFGPGFPGPFGPGFDPYFGYSGFNSIPGSGPNYAWTGTNNGPGFASAGASAGSFAGGYPGTGYPGAGSPSLGGRSGFQDNTPKGGFQDNTPNPNPNPNPNGYGYGGVDPLYNVRPGFYPGQFSNFQDPYEMFRQIQAQIEAQHQAIAKSTTSNHGRPFASNIPNHSYSYSVPPNMNNMRYPTFGSSPNTGVRNSNMELHNRLANEAANYGGGNYGGGPYGGDRSDGPQIASASIGLSPHGGYQSGFISPAGPGIESRFAEELPAPSGNAFGVFASSSSSSKTGPDGKQINHKSSITGVNDNGKISYRTVHDY